MKENNQSNQVKIGHPLDYRHASKRAHWQPLANAAVTIEGNKTSFSTTGKLKYQSEKKAIFLCTYNPQSICDLNRQHLYIMMTELQNVKWDVLGLSGTQIKETDTEILPSGHYLFNSGNETTRSNGVGFIVHKSITPLILSYQSTSDCLAILKLQRK